MRKPIISVLCSIFLFCIAFPMTVSAASNQYGSIKITYSHEEKTFPDQEVRIYKVANFGGAEYFTPTEEFANYPISFSGIENQQQWNDLATTLTGYIKADQIPAYCVLESDDNGVVVMGYMDLGLYLVMDLAVQDGYTFYKFEPAFVYLPQYSDNLWQYDVEVKPKHSVYIPQTEYSVVKLWQDSDNRENRPSQIEVEIYKNDTLWETQILNSENGWRYDWQADADDTRWSVVEKSVPEKYEVLVSENDGVFSIINSYKDDPKDDPKDDSKDDPKDNPKDNKKDAQEDEIEIIPGNPVESIKNALVTGDSHSISIYAFLMCISGILLIITGVYRNRKYNEKK